MKKARHCRNAAKIKVHVDIRFSCENCGQHLVIDTAGAGLVVQCVKCSVSLTVPTSAPLSPPPTAVSASEELRYRCRDLVYELRVAEAISVLKEAEQARARERGYQVSETFNFHGTVQSVVEPAKWAISQSLKNLTSEQEREILGALICSRLMGRTDDEILAVTLGGNLSWPALGSWLLRFKEANHWPSKWEVYPVGRSEPAAEFYERNLNQPTDPPLARIHSLSLKARQVLLAGWLGRIEARGSHLCRSDYDKVIDELASAGFATRRNDLPIVERLCLLQIAKVRELQKQYGVKGARSKEQIASNLLASVPEETLAAEVEKALAVDGFWSDTYVKLNVGYRQCERYWFEYACAKLLADTLDSMMNNYRAFLEFQDSRSDKLLRYEWKFDSGSSCTDDDCPFCRKAAARFVNLRNVQLEDLPPFHPGCDCWARCELVT